jgi:hypothetical protein
MKTRVFPLFFAASLALAAGCARQESAREIDWAKAALARNPAYEIVATDDRAGIFTVRDTATGVVTTLKLEDLVAAPRPPKNAPVAAAAAPAPAEPVEAAAAPEAALAAQQTTREATEEVKAVPAPAGPTISEGPGYSISRGEQSAVTAAAAPAPPKSLEGPGYSITREEPVARAAGRDAEAVAANVEKRSDPMICQGDRLMRIDGETLEFTGDALIAEKGCDLYISNSRIRAGGVGLIARQARVHIVNSTIGGSQGSYEASDGAQIYVARSTFAGIGRRFDGASMTDLGGNSYTSH